MCDGCVVKLLGGMLGVLGSGCRVLNMTCLCQAAWQGLWFVVVKVLGDGSVWPQLVGARSDVWWKACHAERASQLAVVHRAEASESCRGHRG